MEVGELTGRHDEANELRDFVDRSGRDGGALVLRGEAGIGKSALLAATRSYAVSRGIGVLAATGVETETSLAFAGMHQVLRPCLGDLDALPPRHAGALRVAFGLADGPPPDQFLTGLATLELVSERATRDAVLILVDDVQWLDGPSLETLTSVARRAAGEGFGVLLAVREGLAAEVERAGLPSIVVPPLDGDAAEALIDGAHPTLAADARVHVLEVAGGNPLALVELPVAWSGREVPSTGRPPALTDRLVSAFAERSSQRPTATKELLLVQAAHDSDRTSDVMAAARRFGVDEPERALDDAVAAGLVHDEGGRVTFRHPLVRSAAYHASPPAARREAHAAIAAVVDDPDRRAWHRASSLLGTDAEVADDLEGVARRARARGATGIAVAALARSADLTPDDAHRAARLVDAAEMAWERGEVDTTADLLGRTTQLDLSRPTRLQIAWMRQWFGHSAWSGTRQLPEVSEVAAELAQAGDRDRALDFVGAFALRCFWSNPREELRDRVTEIALSLDGPDNDPRVTIVLALAHPLRYGHEVLRRLSSTSPESVLDPATTLYLGTAASSVGAFDVAGPYLESAVDELRARGTVALVAQAQVAQVWPSFYGGRWDRAISCNDEAIRLSKATRQQFWASSALLTSAVVEAARGREDVVRSRLEEAEAHLLAVGAHPFLSLAQLARGILAVGQGRHEEAHAVLSRISDPRDLAYHPFVRLWASEWTVEAAIGSGRRDSARAVLTEMGELADSSGWPLLIVQSTLLRPLVAPEDEAEPLFQ